MNERVLARISVMGACIGIILLYAISVSNFSFQVSIGDIDRSFIGKSVNITGEITGLFSNKGNLFFEVKDQSGKIKVVVWKDALELLEIKGMDLNEIENGKKINIIGSVQLYRGELEIIPLRENVNIM